MPLRGRLKLSLRDSRLVRGLEPVADPGTQHVNDTGASHWRYSYLAYPPGQEKNEDNFVLDPRT
jgi:hypothetical protein